LKELTRAIQIRVTGGGERSALNAKGTVAVVETEHETSAHDRATASKHLIPIIVTCFINSPRKTGHGIRVSFIRPSGAK
jgi:hypothetical protein